MHSVWQCVKDYFLTNQGARYLHLTRQYHNLKQEGITVSDYTGRLKALMDGLADTGTSVSNLDLTMQFLHRLDGHFKTINTILGDTPPLPPFNVVRSCVDPAEYNINLCVAEAGPAMHTIFDGSNSTNDRGD